MFELAKEKGTRINKIRNKQGNTTQDNKGNRNSVREYSENLYDIKLENLTEQEKFSDISELHKKIRML